MSLFVLFCYFSGSLEELFKVSSSQIQRLAGLLRNSMLTIAQTSEFSTATPTLARALACARRTPAKVCKTHVSLSCAAAELRRTASATMSANVGRTGAVMSAEPPSTHGREEKLLRRRGRRAAAYNAPDPPPPPPAPVTPPQVRWTSAASSLFPEELRFPKVAVETTVRSQVPF